MNLINKEVKHGAFGSGCVKSVENGHVTITFSESVGEKVFQYPGAFEQYLKLCDTSAQSAVEQELNELLARISAEKAEKERLYQEQVQLLADEKVAAKKITKKKAAPKAAKTTKAAKKLPEPEPEQEDEEDIDAQEE